MPEKIVGWVAVVIGYFIGIAGFMFSVAAICMLFNGTTWDFGSPHIVLPLVVFLTFESAAIMVLVGRWLLKTQERKAKAQPSDVTGEVGGGKVKINKRISMWTLLFACVAALLLWGVVVVASPVKGPSREDAYDSVRAYIQNAVNGYMKGHNNQLPPAEGQATALNITDESGMFVGNFEVLDICSLVGESGDMLRWVPDGLMGSAGDAGTNFYAGNCDNSIAVMHYVFFVDSEGDVYTGCDCNENGRIEEDGMENVDGFSGSCPADSKAGAEVWP